MTSTNHLLTGATIALAINNPPVAIAAAFVSHFVIDAIPHFGPRSPKDVFERNKKLSFKIMLALSTAASMLVLARLFTSLTGHISLWLLAACLLAAVLPDLIWIPRFLNEIKTGREKPKDFISRLHVKIQRDSLVLGAFDELIWLGLMLLLIVRLR